MRPLLVAATALALAAAPAAVLGAADAASTPRIRAVPAAATPGAPVTVTGRAPGCAGGIVVAEHRYLATKGESNLRPGGVGAVAPDGTFAVSVTVPNDAVYSAIMANFAGPTYDVVELDLHPCGQVLGVNITVLPFSYREHVTLSPVHPRSGGRVTVTATHCRGGPVPSFTQIIDRAGSYFRFSGRTSAGTYRGSVTLRHGLLGAYDDRGPAVPSAPGRNDAIVMVPCAQSTGPASVARADRLQHVRWAVDIHIRPRG